MAETPVAKLLGVTTCLHFVTLLLFGGRIYERARQRSFRWDDHSITLATFLALVEWSLVISATTHGLGHHETPSRRHSTEAHRLLFISEIAWIPTTSFVKIGIAFTLLHFKQHRPWRILLSLLIAAQVVFCIIELVFMMMQCIPIEYVWNDAPHRDAVCTATNTVLASQYVHAGVGTATDLILTLTPLSFAQKGHVPNREGLLLMLLVALGLFTTACSFLRITLLKDYARSSNIWQEGIPITLWSILEVQIALIAANIASFKSPPPPPLPPSHHYSSVRRQRRNPKSRRTSSLTHSDSFQLGSLNLSLTPSHKHNLGLDTNVSSLTGSSTLRRTRSEEMIWPHDYRNESNDGERHDSPFHQMIAAGGILMTTELDIRSEILSRAGSTEGERASKYCARREEWVVAEDGDGVRGDWGAV